ncbi:Uncharacterised protein [Mycobacteroides abscessus subsp. abscessus]|nr:Uncharacterised protein [Mycobacteroides abscessus subsp. abscessus]
MSASSASAWFAWFRPIGRSIRCESAASTRRSSKASLVSRVVRNGRSRPSQFRKLPDFSATAAIGSTTSASSVTAPWRISRLTTNAVLRAPMAAAGYGRSASSTPPTRNASRPFPGSSMPAASSPGLSGNAITPHFSAIARRAVLSATGCAPGSRRGSAPASKAPRSPARRGTHTKAAPVLSASCAAADNAPGADASRSPTMITAPGCRSSSEPARPAMVSGSVPGATTSTSADSLVDPRLTQGAMVSTLSPRLRTPLRSRRKTTGDSSSGSNPASKTAGADSNAA